MGSSRRIIINTVATYGRSLLSFGFTLFTARWVLEALGEEDFGLYGVVGSVMFFIALFNTTQTSTVARYFACAIGKESRVATAGAETGGLTEWFNVAMFVHMVLPLLLLGIGYPLGVCAFKYLLNVPDARMEACLFVLRLSLLALFASTLSVPYVAMFVAHQYISQLVLFSLVQVFGLLAGSYSLLYVTGDRLEYYASMVFLLNLTVLALEVFFARRRFPECRIAFRCMFRKDSVLSMLRYSAWKFLGDLSWGARNYATAFVANVGFGPVANAAISVSNQLSAQAASLCNTLANAFTPAIATEEGAGERVRMIELSLRCCKFGALMLLFVSVPLVTEMGYWLVLWLKTPPVGSHSLCVCMILTSLIAYLTKGHQLAIQSYGKIASWQFCDAMAYLSALPMSIAFVWLGWGLVSIGYSFVISAFLVSVVRVVFAQRLLAFPVKVWLKSVCKPIFLVGLLSGGLAVLAHMTLEEGFCRLVIVTVLTICSSAFWSWKIVLDSGEKMYVLRVVRRVLGHD